MPKGSDSQCPLGFHPQFRRPNYCKRCFREYSDHKSVKEGSTSSVNSLFYDRKDYGSRDSLVSTSRYKDENEGLSASKSDLSRTSSEDDDRRRPLSWSSHDIRKTVEDSRYSAKAARDEFFKYGSVRSLTQDLGTLSRMHQESPKQTQEEKTEATAPQSSNSQNESNNATSYSSYLSNRTKSPIRTSFIKSSTLQETTPDLHFPSVNGGTKDVPKSILRDTLAPISEGKPPKVPVKPRSPTPPEKSGELSPEMSRVDRGKIIHSLREVKSEDADAAYVIKIRPKKSTQKKEEIDSQAEVDRLQKENKELAKRVQEQTSKSAQLENEIKEISAKKTKLPDIKKQTENIKLQSKVDELNEEIRKKTKEMKEMKKEIDKRPLNKNVEKTIEDLRSKLQSSETLCEEVIDENENYKKEIKTLEDEIEELQDNFREDQADEYRDLKRELEQRAKDCRVLQFKLKKAERRSEHLELDKVEVEEKLTELQLGDDDIGRAERVKMMEKELCVAKDVSLKMHEEMARMKEQLRLAETDTKKLKEKVLDAPLKSGTKISRSQVIGRQGSQENKDQLLRDLEDALEREEDMKEQLRFAEEETKNYRKKLSRVEEENETLQLQLGKMSSKAKQSRHRSMERSGSLERSNSIERGSLSRQGSAEKPVAPIVNGEELDPTDMKIQLELNEQESTILRRKVESLESENMRLQKELKELLSSTEPKKTDSAIIPDISRDNLQFNRKIKLLERETSDLKTRIFSLEQERDQLMMDLENAQKNTKISSNGSIGTNESQIKQTPSKLGEENKLLKIHLSEIEEKYEILLDDNKRLTLKSARTLPLKIPENMYIEKQVLEDKLKRTEKRFKDIQEKLKVMSTNASISFHDDSKSEEKIVELQTKIEELQAENNKNKMNINNLVKNERVPKKPRELTPKLTLIKWVNELEEECATLTTALKESAASNSKATGKPSNDEAFKELQDLKDKLQQEQERNEELSRQLKEERGTGKDASSQRKRLGSSISSQENDTRYYEDRIETLRTQLEEHKQKYRNLYAQIEDKSYVPVTDLKAAQAETLKIQRDLASNQQIASGFERKLKEYEESLKISEKSERNLRNLLEKAKVRLEEEKYSQAALEGQKKDLNTSLSKEIEGLKIELSVIDKQKCKFEKDAKQTEKLKMGLESQLISEQKKLEESEGKTRDDRRELNKLREENDSLQMEMSDIKENLSTLKENKEENSLKSEKKITQLLKVKEDLGIRMTTLETELKMEKKKRDRIESDSTLGLRGRATEIENLKKKLTKTEEENNSLNNEIKRCKEEYEILVRELEIRLEKENCEYEDLLNKFKELEESYYSQEAKLLKTSKNNADDTSLIREYETLEQELKTLRETYVSHQDKWIKEKLDLQVQLKEYKDRSGFNGNNGFSTEKHRLKNIIDDKNQQLESLKVENDNLNDQMGYLRREAEDLRRKVDDLDKLQELAEKHQGSSSAVDTKEYESTIRDLRTRFSTLERMHKGETTKMKMRYDSKIKTLTEEINAVSQHMSKYRRERDTYKEMLDGAQKNIAELKGNPSPAYRTSRADNMSEAKAHLSEIQDLQSTITELEDKLADSRLDGTKLRNNVVDQKTNFEIQLSDMQTKLNEYEEDRLLGGGGRRVPGLRTRLELNWQKEREEQQRLIQETAALAKDLRKTLYEVEREKDLERLESKRKIEQLRQTVNLDHHDTKSKVQELQRDLMELREAHAKLRQINEKLRREKDRTEVEREAMRSKFLGSSREQLNQHAKMEKILDQIDKVKELAPLVLGEGIDSFEANITDLPSTPKPKTKQEFTEALGKMSKASSEIRMMLQFGDTLDRMRRTPSLRRTLSTESDDECSSVRSHSTGRRAPLGASSREFKSQLYRKAQSLDHQLADGKGKIWVSTDAGSTSSIESSMADDARRGKIELDRSYDRISAGSQTCDVDYHNDERKKGFKGVFSKFGKSKSIEDSNTGGTIVDVGLKVMAPSLTGSGNSITNETEKDTTVKTKIKSLFKKGQTPRSQCEEKDAVGISSLAKKFEDSPSPTSLKPISKFSSTIRR